MGGQQNRRNNSNENPSHAPQSSLYPAQRSAPANTRNTYPGHRAAGATTQSLNSAPTNNNPASRIVQTQFSHSAPPGTQHETTNRSQVAGTNTVVRGAPTESGSQAQGQTTSTEAATRPGAYQVTRSTTGVRNATCRPVSCVDC